MAVNTAAGSKVEITDPNPSLDWSEADATLITTLDALTWTAVGEVEDLGEFGDEASEITFTSLSDRRTRKFKGTFNAGTISMVAGSDPADAGQQALIAAFMTDFDYPVRVTLNDAITVGGTPTVLYFAGKIMAKRRNVGNVENVVRQSFPIGINTRIVEKAAT